MAKRSLTLAWLLSASVTLGCAGSDSRLADGGVSNSAYDHSSAVARHESAPAGHSASPGFWDKVTDNSMTKSMKKGMDNVSAWFRPTATAGVSGASDPIALNNPAEPTPELYVAMARVQETQGNFEQAETLYSQSLKMDSKNRDALVGLAHMRDRQDRLDEAAGYYQQAVTHHPNDASLHNDLGLCYARRGMLDQAVESLNRAVALTPHKALYRNNIATVLAEMDRREEALSHLAAAHGPAKAHYNLGYLLQQRGEKAAAAEHFAKAAEADPSMQEARAWLARLRPAGTRQARAPQQQIVQRQRPTVRPVSTPVMQPTSQPAETRYPTIEHPPTRYPSDYSNESAAAPPSPGSFRAQQAAHEPMGLPGVYVQ